MTDFTDHDEKGHLAGISRMINLGSISPFVSDGGQHSGLRESASWVFLRQQIYISLKESEPLDIDLTKYQDSSSFQESTDESWTNRMVFNFASVLNFVFGKDEDQSIDAWTALNAEIEDWYSQKSWTFAPLIEIDTPSNDIEGSPNRVWPYIFMFLRIHC